MANRIDGIYAAKGGGDVEYTYEATWTQGEQGVVWSGKVFVQGVLFSTPNGTIARVTSDFVVADLVRTLMEKSIERRSNMS